jgi:hypothetical protein
MLPQVLPHTLPVFLCRVDSALSKAEIERAYAFAIALIADFHGATVVMLSTDKMFWDRINCELI